MKGTRLLILALDSSLDGSGASGQGKWQRTRLAVAVPRWLTGVRPTSGYGALSPMGFRSTGLGRRGGPIAPTSGKRQAVEAADVDRAARADIGVVGGGFRCGSNLVFFSYGSGEA
jgi:hypothetical protein